MSVIQNIDDFKNITSTITSFSHAYIFKVNDMEQGLLCAKEFAKKILFDSLSLDFEIISYQIDLNEYDDLYIVNPPTVTINTSEISKLMNYMKTKSLHANGKRIYIICGYERINREVSNKLLKFLEEPDEDIYGILLTMDIDKILPTIISRCQVLSLNFNKKNDFAREDYLLMIHFLEEIMKRKNNMIAYYLDYFSNDLSDRDAFYKKIDILEYIISESLNKKISNDISDKDDMFFLEKNDVSVLTSLLSITNNVKSLVKKNLNLSLLLDRYIIEFVREL